MKYRGARELPPSVAVWLEQQLEARGIDSLAYSHYILSLLGDQPNEIDELPSLSKVTKTISNNWINCNLEDLKKSAVNCLADLTSHQDIEDLVDELCVKLEEVDSNFGNCLKEKTNSEDLFNLELPVCSPGHSSKYFSALPTLNRENIGIDSCSLIEKPVWTKSISRTLGRRKDSESSPKENKISKRKEGKENAKGRMRSRSTVKSQNCMRSRSGMAKSLDRSEKGRKCLFTAVGTGTSGKEDKGMVLGREEEFENLPMDFQSLLQSPDNNLRDCFLRNSKAPQPESQLAVQQPTSGNFIQCGTNITSSIWSTEKMEEDESMPWEEVGKYVGWSDARNSLLSSAWKLPFAYGNVNSNNNVSSDKTNKKEDIEGTTLALKNEGAFFSLFNDNSNHLSLLKATNIGQKSDSHCIVEPPKKKLENLLTSMKTHFIPIKQESVEVNAPTYNDGSSFFNLSSFEEVKYRRSESGSLFLGPHQKYMEFKRTDLTNTPPFVPKFRVCSNEKYCQTDDLPSDDDEPPTDQHCDSKFFFPDDEHYAEEMIKIRSFSRIEVSGWVTTCPVTTASDIWNSDGQTWVVGADENWNSTEGAGRREDYTQLRHEITQEGEQLLSDIRYLLQDHRPKNGLLVGSSGL